MRRLILGQPSGGGDDKIKIYLYPGHTENVDIIFEYFHANKECDDYNCWILNMSAAPFELYYKFSCENEYRQVNSLGTLLGDKDAEYIDIAPCYGTVCDNLAVAYVLLYPDGTIFECLED